MKNKLTKNLKTLIVLLLGFIILGCSTSTSSDDPPPTPTVPTVPTLAPDLVVSVTASPTTISSGGTVSLSATVRNSGLGASSSTILRYYRSSTSTISTSNTELATDTVASLAAFSSGSESASVTGHSSGTMYYGACVDSVSGESNTANNCSVGRAVAVRTGGNPDLVVSVTASPATINARGTITLSATVRNSGNGASTSTTLRYYRSSTSTISASDTELDTDFVSSISAGSSGSESASVTGHNSGTMYYGACVDSVSGESSTTNNCSVGRAVTVSGGGGGGNITFDSMSINPTTISSGGNITITMGVTNSSSTSANVTFNYYLGSLLNAGTCRSSAVPLDPDTTTIHGNNSDTYTQTLTITGSPGSYSIGVKATSGSTTHCRSRSFSISSLLSQLSSAGNSINVESSSINKVNYVNNSFFIDFRINNSTPLPDEEVILSTLIQKTEQSDATIELSYYTSTDSTIDSELDTQLGSQEVIFSNLDNSLLKSASLKFSHKLEDASLYFGVCLKRKGILLKCSSELLVRVSNDNYEPSFGEYTKKLMDSSDDNEKSHFILGGVELLDI